jgi:uncharacterized membrane protein YhaH (DUF805 family)
MRLLTLRRLHATRRTTVAFVKNFKPVMLSYLVVTFVCVMGVLKAGKND